MTHATVTKSKETSHWLVKYGGKVADMGKSAASCHNAHWLAVTMNHPDIAYMVSQLLAKWEVKGLEKRAQKGAILSANGHVRFTASNKPEHLRTRGGVRSQSDPDHYYIIQQWPGVGLTCSCPDYKGEKAPLAGPQRLCKHVIAFMISWSFSHNREPQAVNVTRFRGDGTFKVNGRIPVRKEDPPQYANGDDVASEDLAAFRTWVDAHHIAPFNREKLISWHVGA